MCLPSCSRGSGIQNPREGFKGLSGTRGDDVCNLSSAAESYRPTAFVSLKLRVIEIDCQQVRRELSNYLEGDLTPELRLQIDSHLAGCGHCAAVRDGLRNVVQLLGNDKLLELPEGFGKRLYQRLLSYPG